MCTADCSPSGGTVACSHLVPLDLTLHPQLRLQVGAEHLFIHLLHQTRRHRPWLWAGDWCRLRQPRLQAGWGAKAFKNGNVHPAIAAATKQTVHPPSHSCRPT